jgi:hypothetical protein
MLERFRSFILRPDPRPGEATEKFVRQMRRDRREGIEQKKESQQATRRIRAQRILEDDVYPSPRHREGLP